MQRKQFIYFISALFFIFAASCAGGQPEAVTTTPEGNDSSIKEAQITETPEEAPIIESASCDLPLPGPDDWAIILCEHFDDNRNGWQVESQDNPYAKYTSSIRDGKFLVEYEAKGFADYQHTAVTWFTIGEVKDFALSIKGSIETPFRSGVSWGIAFRGDTDSFYLFSISKNGTYSFEVYENDEWTPLISPRDLNGTRLGTENILRIEAGGQDFYFSINGTMVDQYSGALLEGEEILLVVSANEGVRATFKFDDVVLQR
ncbi:MAG: hypothetical protein J7K66_02195 [Anaerolineaceae bacterium]|nr:hypothetical protein [Anaerolineaceae bacterium]